MQDFNLAELDRWPLAVKALCCAVTAACVLAFGYYLFLANLRTERIGAQREWHALRDEHAGKAAAAGRLPARRADRDQTAAAFAAMLRHLPTQPDLPAVVADIDRAAATRGLAVIDIALAPERETALYLEQPIAIAVTGAYHDLGAFSADIAALAMLVTTHDFEIQPANDNKNGGLTMAATLKTYRYLGEVGDKDVVPGNDVVSDNAGAPAPPWLRSSAAAYRPAGKRDPFRPSAAAWTAQPVAGETIPPSDGRTRQPLERHPLEQLRMVGTLAANGVRHALFHAPDGVVHRVATGDYLGTDNGQLRNVHDAGVELVEVVRDGAGGWLERPRTIALDETASAEDDQRRNQ